MLLTLSDTWFVEHYRTQVVPESEYGVIHDTHFDASVHVLHGATHIMHCCEEV